MSADTQLAETRRECEEGLVAICFLDPTSIDSTAATAPLASTYLATRQGNNPRTITFAKNTRAEARVSVRPHQPQQQLVPFKPLEMAPF